MRREAIGNQNATTLEIDTRFDRPRLWLQIGEPTRNRCVAVADGACLVIGSHATCDVVVQDRTVSSRHCQVSCHDGQSWVEDLSSRNGVYAGGARVERAELCAGASFVIGRVAIAVHAGPLENAIPAGIEPLPDMVGRSPQMLQVSARVRRLANIGLPVLIQGATGTGKELVARSLHALGPRACHSFVAINAGCLPRELAQAELFGHDRGAFTGAHVRREGAFVAANHGTLFLDEVGELSLDNQVNLLRVLEDGVVRPLGSSRGVRVDVRIVAATWSPLERLIEQGRFRADLYHRLAVGMVRIPSLSERRSDISALVDHFLDAYANDIGAKQMSSAALAALVAQPWPGNVRQLKNVILRAALAADGPIIRTQDLESAVSEEPLCAQRMSPTAAKALVSACEGKVAAAARACGIPRSTFRGWLRNAQQDIRTRADAAKLRVVP